MDRAACGVEENGFPAVGVWSSGSTGEAGHQAKARAEEGLERTGVALRTANNIAMVVVAMVVGGGEALLYGALALLLLQARLLALLLVVG